MTIAKILARGKYKRNRLSVYDTYVFISDKNDDGINRCSWLDKRTAICMAKKILKTYGVK